MMNNRNSEERKFRRQQRISETLRRELYEITLREVKDPRLLNSFTITEIDLKPDLKSATVYVSRFKGEGIEGADFEPTEAEQKELLEGLRSASHFIYERLKRRLQIKVVPTVRFEYDFRMAQAANVWNLTNKLKQEREG